MPTESERIAALEKEMKEVIGVQRGHERRLTKIEVDVFEELKLQTAMLKELVNRGEKEKA